MNITTLHLKKIAILGLALVPGLMSADDIWKGTSSTLWATGLNWGNNAAPTASDVVIYNNTSTANWSNYLSTSYSIKGILVTNVPAVTSPGGISINSTNAGTTLTLGASGIDMTGATTNLVIAMPVVLGANQSWLVTNTRTLTVSGIVSGSGNLLKDTPNATSAAFGQLTLNGANTFTGALTINAGKVFLGNASALGNSNALVSVNSGAQINWNGAYTIAKSFEVSGTGVNNDGVLRAGASTASTINGNLTMLADALALKMDGGSSFTLNGNINGTNRNLTITLDGTANSTVNGAVTLGTGSFTKTSGSTATLILNGGSNVWSGGTTISGGLTIGNGGTGSIGTGTINDNGTLTFNTTSALTINDVIQGTGSLAANGTGALTLDAANLYTGNTTIGAAGRLNLAAAGSIPNTSTATLTVNGILDVTAPGSITIGGTQTLTGSGTIRGNVDTVSGTTLTGTHLIQGNLTLASGANVLPNGINNYGQLAINGNTTLDGPNLTFDLSNVATESPTLNDEIYANGALIVNGVTTIFLNPRSGALAPGAYILIRYNGVRSGSGSFVLDQPANGLAIDTSVPGVVRLVVTPAAQLTWVGDGALNDWDLNLTANWNNGGPAVFRQYDNVLFTDTGSASPPVNVTTNVKPTLVTVDATASYTITGSGKLSGGASLLKTNSGTLVLSTANNDYTGPTIIKQGTLSFQDVGTLPAFGGISIQTGAIADFYVGGTNINIGAVTQPSITGGGTWQVSGGLVALGNQGSTAYKVNVRLAAGSLIDVAGGTLRNGGWQGGFWTDGLTWTNLSDLNVNGTFDVWDGNPVYVNALNGGGSVGIAGVGTGSGTRTLNLGVDNGSGSFSGVAVCNLGTSTNSNLTITKLGIGTQYLDRFTRGNGGTGTATLNVNGGTAQLGGSLDNVATVANVNAGGILELAKSSSSTVHALGGTLTVNSNGLCRLTGTGGDQIYLGSTMTVNAGGTLDLNGQSEGGNGLNGAGLIESTTGPATLTVGGNNGGGTFSGLLTDYAGNALALAKVGTGTQIITGTNAYTGGTTVALGTLQYGNGPTYSVPTGDIGLVNPTNAASAQLRFVITPTNTVVYNGNITNGPSGGGNLYLDSTNATLVLGGVNTFIGNVTIRAGNLWIKNSSGLGIGPKLVDLTAGTIGNPSLHLDGSGGSINLDGSISYNTSSFATGAIVNEAGDNVVNGSITLTSGGGDTGIFAIAGSLTLNGSLIPNTASRNLQIGGAGNGTNTTTGYIADGSSPLVGLRKLGAGSWTLLGNNTYSGTTAVEGGRLVLGATGQLPTTSSINVFTNATLDVSPAAAALGGAWTNNGKPFLGRGIVVGSVTLANNTLLQPGGSGIRGTLTFNDNLTLSLGVTNQFDLGTDLTAGSGSNDLVQVTGNLDPQGSTISINALQPLSPGTYRLFNYTGTKLSSFNATPLTNASTTSHYTLAVDETIANQVNLIVSGTVSNLTWYGATTNWDINATANWDLGTLKYFNFDTVTFDDTSLTNLVNLVGTLAPTSVTFNNSATNYTVQGTGKISGLTGISKSGTASLRINTANDFIGPVNVSGGTLMAGNATAFGATNGAVTIASGATLDVNALNLGQKPVVASGTGVGNNGAIINSSLTGQVNALNTVTLAGDTTFGGGGRWDIRANGVPLASLSTGGNAYNLTKVSTNQFSLVSVAVDPALADINVVGGLFGVEANSTGLGNPLNQLTVWSNAQLQFWGPTNQINKPIVLNGGTNWCLNNGSATATVISPVTLNVSSIINVSATSMTLNGPIGETNSLTSMTKIGTGVLVLGGTNTYSGGTLVTAGTLQLGNGGVGGSAGTGAITNDGGTLQFNRSDDYTFNNPVYGTNGAMVKTNSNTITLGATNSYLRTGASVVQINGGTMIVPTNTAIISGGEFWVAQNAVTGACIINGGTITCSNWFVAGRNNTNAMGTITLNSGTINKIGGGNVILGSIGGNGTLNVNGGTFYNNSLLAMGENAGAVAVLNLNGGLVQCTALSRYNALGLSSIANFNGGTLLAYTNSANFIAVNNANVKVGGLVLDDGGFVITNTQTLLADVASPGGGLTKLGAGTLYLNSTNTYTGLTRVNGGTLAGNVTVSGPLTVGASGMLLPGPGTIFPVGTVTAVGTITLGGTLAVDVSKDIGVNVSDLVVGGTINYGGTLTVTQLGVVPLADGDSFKLFNAGLYTGAFSSINPAAPGTGLAWDTSYLTADGTLRVKVNTMPGTPAPITATYDGSNLHLSWPAAYLGLLLQTETNSLSNGLTTTPADWHTIPGSGSTTSVTIPVNPANPSVFYRLVKP